MKRRDFLKSTTAVLGGTLFSSSASGSTTAPASEAEDPYGVLVDVDKCIGCRKCEWACNGANHLPQRPLETFEDKSVFAERRRPDAENYTVVNQVLARENGHRPVWVKVQCMHCNTPACSSACIVTAFQKQSNGPVSYDSWRCMGCRYCMVACPFQIPAYEYDEPLAPKVRKCTFCLERISKEGGVPACVEICPPQCLTFARRSELLDLAHRKIQAPDSKYQDHVYGEHEVGGTSWLYISSLAPTEMGFPELGSDPPGELTEKIQHGVFKGFFAPLAWFALLAGIMRIFRPEKGSSS